VGIVEDVTGAAQWMAQALTSSEYRADFTPGSMWEVERFFDEQASNGQAAPRGLLSEDLGQRIFGLGAYVGEVLRQDRGGVWQGHDDDLQAEINIALHLSDGTVIWPVQRAMKRFSNGPEDSIVAYAAGLGVEVGPRPTPRRRGIRHRRK
jgi:hypothetical protein